MTRLVQKEERRKGGEEGDGGGEEKYQTGNGEQHSVAAKDGLGRHAV